MKDNVAALADFSKAIVLQPDEGNNDSVRGKDDMVLRIMLRRYRNLTRSIEFQPDNVSPI